MGKPECMRYGRREHITWQTTLGKDCLENHAGRWMLLVWHGGAFDGVSTTELLALQRIYEELQRQSCDVMALSRDSHNTLMAWVYHIYENTGIEITFPLVTDRTGEIAHSFGLSYEEETMERVLLLIDPGGKVRAGMYYPNCVGRSTEEILRLLKAMQLAEQEGLEVPADWKEGVALVLPKPQDYEELLQRSMDRQGLCCMDWYLCFTDEGGTWRQRRQKQKAGT